MTNPTDRAKINRTIAEAMGIELIPVYMPDDGTWHSKTGAVLQKTSGLNSPNIYGDWLDYTTDATALLDACAKLGYFFDVITYEDELAGGADINLTIRRYERDEDYGLFVFYECGTVRGKFKDLTILLATALAEAIGKGK